MRILLLGEYSNVHATLAEGLRSLGHQVTVLSNGDFWKNYPRDIDLVRTPGKLGGIRYILRAYNLLPQLKGFDIVQLINPMFLELKAERILPFYKKLRRQNGKIFLGSFGIDKPWVEEGLKPTTFRYSDFYLFGTPRHNQFIEVMKADWLNGAKGKLFDYIASDCDGIIASLYENHVCCQAKYADKLHFIPFPINLSTIEPRKRIINNTLNSPIRFFIGIQKSRSEYKGTDIMFRALQHLQMQYPELVEIRKAENIPFSTYQDMMGGCDVLLDQLYSYTPAMNGLLAMAKGLVLVGGAEEEHYQMMGEKELRPIINVQPNENDVTRQIEERVLSHPESLRNLSCDSIKYVHRHHNHIQVAKQYIEVWSEK